MTDFTEGRLGLGFFYVTILSRTNIALDNIIVGYIYNQVFYFICTLISSMNSMNK